LYGQCGAKTSTFYEKDIAACTTATGRLLLTYAKKIIEECYGDALCNTKELGPVLTKAEYIYGDSVANYTPVYIKRNGTAEIITIEKLAQKYSTASKKMQKLISAILKERGFDRSEIEVLLKLNKKN
jgi:DNA polymerase elongation subunit (family B)